MQMEYDPEGSVENIGDKLGLVSGRVEGDLERFRDYVESRGVATGAWRGEVKQDATGSGSTARGTG